MDSDIAHESISSVNGRKRKAEAEEPQIPSPSDSTPSDTMLVDSMGGQNPSSNAPRQPPTAPWLSRVSPTAGNGVWSSSDGPPISPLTEMPDEPPRCQKRPRIEREESPQPMKPRHPKRQRVTESHHNSRFWRKCDIRDMGIVPTRDPGPISGSLYRVKGGPCAPECSHHLLPSPLPPINLNSPHIPVLTPLINRGTLKELDLNAILRNPQLRMRLIYLLTIRYS